MIPVNICALSRRDISGLTVLREKVGQFPHELVDVLELAIDRSESDIGHAIEIVELFHDSLTYDRTSDFSIAAFNKALFDATNDFF
jgi:hypothetical protein